eukprot:29057_1
MRDYYEDSPKHEDNILEKSDDMGDYGFSNAYPTLSRIFDCETFKEVRVLPETITHSSGQDRRRKSRPLPKLASVDYSLDFPPTNKCHFRPGGLRNLTAPIGAVPKVSKKRVFPERLTVKSLYEAETDRTKKVELVAKYPSFDEVTANMFPIRPYRPQKRRKDRATGRLYIPAFEPPQQRRGEKQHTREPTIRELTKEERMHFATYLNTSTDVVFGDNIDKGTLPALKRQHLGRRREKRISRRRSRGEAAEKDDFTVKSGSVPASIPKMPRLSVERARTEKQRRRQTVTHQQPRVRPPAAESCIAHLLSMAYRRKSDGATAATHLRAQTSRPSKRVRELCLKKGPETERHKKTRSLGPRSERCTGDLTLLNIPQHSSRSRLTEKYGARAKPHNPVVPDPPGAHPVYLNHSRSIRNIRSLEMAELLRKPVLPSICE